MLRSQDPGRTLPVLLAGLCVIAAAVGPACGQATKQAHACRVFGTDDRQPVEDTTAAPWSAIGMIVAHWGESSGYEVRIGTGTLISGRLVLSCGHVVYDKVLGWPERVYFVPGQNAHGEPFGSFQAATVITTDQWATNQDDGYDLSMLLLPKPVSPSIVPMRVVGQPPSFFVNRMLNMSGYPSDLGWSDLYNAAGQSQGVIGNLIHHMIDGTHGQSGGPMWFADPATGQATLVGVYTGDVDVVQNGQIIDTYGYGVQINATLCSWISSHASQLDSAATVSCEAAQDAGPASTTAPVLLQPSTCGGGTGGAISATLIGLGLMNARRRV